MDRERQIAKLSTIAAEVGGRVYHELLGGPGIFCTDPGLCIESAVHHGLHGSKVAPFRGGCVVYWPHLKGTP